jgi:lipopolysaccharide export system protein LptA
MPNGRVAQLQPTTLDRLAAAFVSEVRALSSTIVEPVGRNVRVTLAFLRNDGVLEDDKGHVNTDDTGSYARLFLPSGFTPDGPGGRFLVYVGSGDSLTRAFVCSSVEATNINFNSEAAVRLILEYVATNPLVRLDDYSAAEICEINEAIVELPGNVPGNNAAEVNFNATELAREDDRIIDLIERAGGAPNTPTPAGPTPTNTPVGATNTPVTPTATPTTDVQCPATASPTASPDGVQIIINNGIVNANNKIVVDISLVTGGESVGGMQNDIIFDNRVVTLPSASACVLNPALGPFPNGPPPAETCDDNVETGPCKTLNRVLSNCGATPLPPGCPEQNVNLSRFRAIIAATGTPNDNPIPDGVLYTCTFDVAFAEGLPTALENSNVVVSDPTGGRVQEVTAVSGFATIGGVVATASCGDSITLVDASRFPDSGTILVDNQMIAYTKSGNTLNLAQTLNQIAGAGEIVYLVPTLEPTPTPTEPSGPPTATPTATRTGVQINVGTGAVNESNQVVIDVTLADGGNSVGGVQNDIIFDHTAISLPQASRCVLNPALGMFPLGLPPAVNCGDDPEIGPCKTLSRDLRNCGDSPLPQGCPEQNANLSRFRAIIAATATPNDNPIPDGVLYTCTFDVVSVGALPTVLDNMNLVASDPLGERVEPVSGDDGLATIAAEVAVSAVSGATSITVDNAASFPAGGFLLINNQLVSFTKSGNTLNLGEALHQNAPVGTTVFLALEGEPPSPTPTEAPTDTPVPPTATFTEVVPTATNTPVTPTATDTVAVPTETPTNTPVTPTATDTVPVPTDTPTNTPVPPTNTPVSTPTATTPVGPTPNINVGMSNGVAGQTVAISVTLIGGNNNLTATSNDIIYDPTQVRVVLNGSAPDCVINPALATNPSPGKMLLASVATVGGGMQRLRAGVVAFSNSNPIPDGLLFTCNFEIDAAATPGAKLLDNLPSASDALGDPAPVGGADGAINVQGAALPAIDVGEAMGAAGAVVSVSVMLSGGNNGLTATSNDIIYDPTQVRVVLNGSAPDCTINPALATNPSPGKMLLASVATVGGGMQRLRAGVVAFSNSNPVPDGLLFTCNFEIDAAATAGAKILSNTPSASDALGDPAAVDGADGMITVTAAPTGPTIDVGNASGAAGAIVSVAVTLSGANNALTATSNDIIYDPTQVRVVLIGGSTPDCAINPALATNPSPGKMLLASVASVGGGAMQRLRAGVVAFSNSNPVPDGMLFTCNFQIDAAATAGAKTLSNTPSASDALGDPAAVEGADGTITVQ